jgi:hypothetical protein
LFHAPIFSVLGRAVPELLYASLWKSGPFSRVKGLNDFGL